MGDQSIVNARSKTIGGNDPKGRRPRPLISHLSQTLYRVIVSSLVGELMAGVGAGGSPSPGQQETNCATVTSASELPPPNRSSSDDLRKHLDSLCDCVLIHSGKADLKPGRYW